MAQDTLGQPPVTEDAPVSAPAVNHEPDDASPGDEAAPTNQKPTTLKFKINREARKDLLGSALAVVSDQMRALGYASPLYKLRLKGRHPLKLLGSPADPWPGSNARGTMLLNGRLDFARHVTPTTDGGLWDRLADAPRLHLRHAQSFTWLRDLEQTTERQRAQSMAEGLTAGWLKKYADYDPQTWHPLLLSRRICQWMTHAPLILSTHDLVYRSAVLNALVRQARHLARTAPEIADPMDRVECCTALIMSGLLLPEGDARADQGQRHLRRTLDTLVYRDGGVATRRVWDAVEVMQHLILLKDSYALRSLPTPEWLLLTLDRLAPFIRALRHQDAGASVAHFNGAGGEPEGFIERVLTTAGAKGKAIDHMPFSGFQRLKRRRTMILVDAGPPPSSDLGRKAHAGTLSFEMSEGGTPMIVNLGGADHSPAADGELAALARTTAAHSTLTVEDKNSTELLASGLLGRGVAEVSGERVESRRQIKLVARHDGYVRRFGFIHERQLVLDPDGDALTGDDLLIPKGDKTKPVRFDVRFHLHPSVVASPTQDGHSIILRLANKHGWRFRSHGSVAVLEDSLYLDPFDRPRRSQQIVISGEADPKGAAVAWSLERIDGKTKS